MDAENIPTGGELIVYQTDDGRVKLDVRLQDETIWLTQADLAELFHVKPQNITIHLKNIYAEGELQEDATCKEFLQVQTEGVRKVGRARKSYNLDAVISVGYRIQSRVATHWTTFFALTTAACCRTPVALARRRRKIMPRKSMKYLPMIAEDKKNRSPKPTI